MKIGVPSEVKVDEYRVAMTPAGVRELTDHGHEVVIQSGAGVGSAISDDDARDLARILGRVGENLRAAPPRSARARSQRR